MGTRWKENWSETRENFIKWWNRDGLVVGGWSGDRRDTPRVDLPEPRKPASIEEHYLNTSLRVQRNHYNMTRRTFPLDVLPMPDTNFGPGTLATFLGSEPGISETTVWYHPSIADVSEPEGLPPFELDRSNKWYQHMHRFLAQSVQAAGDDYMIGYPDIIENIDILASLRNNEVLCMDMIERPEWVEQKVAEINQVYFQAYGDFYELIKDDDGGSAFCAFGIWGPGKTAKVQCDAAAMFSPNMFKRFVVPALTQQCEWLDNSLFHLDGKECIYHLDLLLEIDALDAVQWTPGASSPGGGSPQWHDMYRRILDAGKSVQVGAATDEIVPLLDKIGSKGVYIMTNLSDEATVEKVAGLIEPYR